MHRTTIEYPGPEIRRVIGDRQFGDENIAAAVALAFTKSDRFWEDAEGSSDLSTLARDLVPCERSGHELVCRYLACARDGLRLQPEFGRDSVALDVIQLGLQMVWGEGDPPLTSRTRHPRYPQFDQPLEILERVLSGRCAAPECSRPAQRDAYGQVRRSASRAVCCSDHEGPHGAVCRRRVRDLLATALAVLDGSDICQI